MAGGFAHHRNGNLIDGRSNGLFQVDDVDLPLANPEWPCSFSN
jgi:hypothetical protein